MPMPTLNPDSPQPVRTDLLLPHLDTVATFNESARLLLVHTHDGALTKQAADSFAACLRKMRDATDAMAEVMRLKLARLDCVTALFNEIPRDGIGVSALYQRLRRRSFRSEEMRAALQALIERGDLLSVPDPERPAGKRGPTPMRLVWRKNAT